MEQVQVNRQGRLFLLLLLLATGIVSIFVVRATIVAKGEFPPEVIDLLRQHGDVTVIEDANGDVVPPPPPGPPDKCYASLRFALEVSGFMTQYERGITHFSDGLTRVKFSGSEVHIFQADRASKMNPTGTYAKMTVTEFTKAFDNSPSLTLTNLEKQFFSYRIASVLRNTSASFLHLQENLGYKEAQALMGWNGECK